jgi:uracil-DNA glycosylase family 4
VTPGERREALESVAAEVRACTRCRLHAGRTRAVPGEGSPETEVVFVGEAPGFNEDRQGRPFVGAAGSFLTELLSTVGWRREDVFITNVVKCRPPENRDPEPDEIAACAPFLARQLEIMDPALVVTLGRHSLGTFLPGIRIGQVHGTARPPATAEWADGSLVFAMYHPAAALHQGSLRRTLLDDMRGIPRSLLDARDRRALAAETVDAQVPAGALPPGPDPDGRGPEPGADADASAFPPPTEPGADQLTLFS